MIKQTRVPLYFDGLFKKKLYTDNLKCHIPATAWKARAATSTKDSMMSTILSTEAQRTMSFRCVILPLL